MSGAEDEDDYTSEASSEFSGGTDLEEEEGEIIILFY